MTVGVIAVCTTRPDVEAEIAALVAAGPDLFVRPGHRSPILELLDDEEHPVLAVDGPRLVQVPGEVRRLLGASVPDDVEPVWWVEMRVPSERDAAPAHRLAEQLVQRCGGFVWARRD
jgi:hypothetical protein